MSCVSTQCRPFNILLHPMSWQNASREDGAPSIHDCLLNIYGMMQSMKLSLAVTRRRSSCCTCLVNMAYKSQIAHFSNHPTFIYPPSHPNHHFSLSEHPNVQSASKQYPLFIYHCHCRHRRHRRHHECPQPHQTGVWACTPSPSGQEATQPSSQGCRLH